eukprot:CAMPEP_0198147638 /NCGR_PEP_ID=MMETSP1443-20131203/36914_1 /TAXON_ID=186043 /ORGANISM="Entomoneis sp., Strain CCMP2396" /LENGTH=485 /DNA_ID=CAMNT_0043812051 /DNA_START=186 /DNA_END=1643 /DNA_ORIENTATION=-
MSIRQWIVLLLLLGSCVNVVTSAANGKARKFVTLNEGTRKIELYWIHPQTRDAVIMSNPDIMPGADFPLDSFIGHAFEAREMKCKQDLGSCKKCAFKVSSNDDQRVHVNEDFECEFVDNKIKARKEATDLVGGCHEEALARVSSVSASGDEDVIAGAMKELVACVQGGVSSKLEEINEEIAFQASVRRDIAANLENYTCLDDGLDSSDTVEEQMWIHDRDVASKRRKVSVMLDRPASKIHLIENFISPEECKAMEDSAAVSLHHATVADGKGGSQLSDNRKAMQAGIKVPWKKELSGDHIAGLSRRVYDYTNDVLDLGIEEFGQEDLMSIQYFGRGFNDTEPDRYTPHCDGECVGLPHKLGTRMATMVMYCDVADRGGHTNFRNAGVHIKPLVGSAIFFSYIDPETRTMDSGFTEHSGCPVFEGEKKIVTQWIRLGVDSENPWDSFNTLGIKHSVAQQYSEGEEYEEEEDDEDEDEESQDGEDEL